MRYTPNQEEQDKAHQFINDKQQEITVLGMKLKKEKIFQLKQEFAFNMAHLLEKENIEATLFLGFLGSQIEIKETNSYLSYGFHFDICAPQRNINYCVSPKEFENRQFLANYARRTHQKEAQVIKSINNLAHAFNHAVQKILQEDKIKLTFNQEKPFTQSVSNNMSLVMTEKELALWTTLKEQYELNQQLPMADPNPLSKITHKI